KGRASCGEQLRPRLGRHGVTAGAQEKANAEPIFEQADLPAHGPMGDVELVRRAGEAAEPCGSLEALDRIQRRQARTKHAVNFPHSPCQNKSFVINASQTLKCTYWGRVSGAPNNSRGDGIAS